MSRVINTSLATIQFQVNARQANAAMQALQEASDDLNRAIDSVNRNIANLGKDVPKDNPQLLNYQNQLAGLKKDLKDVEKAQRDFLKGAKAADQLWKAASEGTIESLSFRSIKAGINGLKKRQEGLSPGDAQDMKDWRIIKEVIDEADRVMKQAGADVQNVVQTIREGGKVSEQAMRQTISTLKELKGSVDETDAEYRTYGSDLDFMEAKLQEFNEAQRRAKGEIVDANDARREMNKLTEEGAAAAKREAEEADRLVASLKQESEELVRKRGEIKQNIEDTQKQIDENHKLIEEKHRQLAADEETFNAEQQGRRESIDGLKQQAEAERKLANEKSDAAETHRRAADLQKQTTEQLTEKVTELQGKLAELNAEPVKPKVDSSALDALKTELNEIESQLTSMGDRHTAEMTAFNQRLWKKQDRMKEIGAQQYLPHTTDPNADYYNFGNKAKKIIKSFAAGGDDRRYDLMQSLAERGGYLEKLKELESEHRAIVKQRTEYYRAMDETGKKDWEEAIRQLDELDGLYSTVINILKDYKQEFDKIKPADDAHLEKYEQLTERRATLLEKIASVEQQSASATNNLTEAQRLYNDAVERRKQKEQELKEIQERSYNDDPEVKRINEEIAKLEELIAVTDKYKKQFTKMSDKKFEEGYMGDDAEVKKNFRTGLDPTKYIYGAEDYLASAYRDRFNANFHKLGIRKPGDDGYEKDAAAADRVAKGIVENAQEALRRAILHEIEDGTLSSASMEEMVENFRRKMYQAAREAGEGNLKDDPEYNTYKYIIAQMEKYLEVAKKVEEERAKIAGGGEFLEMARYKDDINAPREGLLRQREKREFQDLTGFGDFKRRQEEAEGRKSQEVTQAKNDEKEAERQLNEEKAKGIQATKSETEAVKKLKEELKGLEDARAQAKDDLDWQETDLKEYLDRLEKVGLKEEDLTDEAKVQQSIEKATAEILKDQLETEKQMAELKSKFSKEVSLSDLGGTKKDREFYLDTKNQAKYSDHADESEIYDRISELEEMNHRKVGKHYEDLDDDETWTEQMKEDVKNELRYLKQHLRENILQFLKDGGDIESEEIEPGFDSDFAAALASKIDDIRDDIKERVKDEVVDTYKAAAEKLGLDPEHINDLDQKGIADEVRHSIESDRREALDRIAHPTDMMGNATDDRATLRQKIGDYDTLIAAKKEEIRLAKEDTQAAAESNQQSEEELRLKGELEEAQGKLAESKQCENDEQQQSVKLQAEAIEQGNKAAEAETKLADAQSDATQKQVEFNQKQQEGLDSINQMAQGNQALQQSIDGLNGELEQNSKDYAENAAKTAEAEQKKAQARQLSIKTMEEMLAKLKEEYYTEELTAEKREEHKQKIKELDEALRLAKGEWMSYADAMKYANSIGSDGFMATDEQTKMATDALTRHREELTKTIQQKEADSQVTSAERAELEKLDQALTKIKTGFTGADDVMARWAEHMNAGKQATEAMSQQTETLAQTLDEKLAGATSSWDAKIAEETSYLEDCNKELDEYEQELQELSDELKELEQKHSNRSWLWKKTYARQYQWEDERIKWLREETGSGNTFDEEGKIKRVTQKGLVDDLRNYKQSAQERLAKLKQLKAEELGLTESEVQAEEKKADVKKLTNEQMQQGIKLLEEEYAKTDHTTEEGIKKRQQLREAIDQMNQELKESTGEWMSLADAEKLAAQAEQDTFLNKEGTGFTASAQDIQKATQALERQRDVILQTIKAKRDSGKATDDEEKELQDLTNKLKALKFEQDNFNMSQAKMQELMRTPTNATSLDELRAAIKRADGELKRMEGSLGQNNAQYKAFAEQVRNAKNQLKEMEGQAKASATAWEKAWSRLKTYVVMYMGFNAVWQKMVGTADDIMQLSDKMGEVRKTTGFTADEVGRLSDNLKKLDVRTPLTQLMEISAKAGQLGLKSEQDVMGFTEAANKLMIALPEMGAEAATEMMKVAIATGEVKRIQDQLNQGLIEGSSATEVALSKVGSTIDQLRANSAAAAPQITDFVKRVGAVGAQSNISIDQVAALGATVDALGMRVEMSATALSRMIPAIRNNAFDVAKAIGMAPNALRAMFDEAGGGMEAMLAIFQHIKDAGMDADSIEKMLNMGGMQDVMKQLNQQGARAGIVFAGLSQNVDELRKNLNVATEAYEDNIAILQEYNKMNDTTAAKWERFKNQLEEFFVGDFTQSVLGGIIDFLRLGLDFLTGSNGWSAAFRTIGVYLLAVKLNIASIFSGVKNIGVSLKGIAMTIGLIDKETKKLAWGNIFTALAMAALWAWREIVKLKTALDKAGESLGKTKEEIEHSLTRFDSYWQKLESTSEALQKARTRHEKLSEEVDKLRKTTDGSAESTANLKKKEDELETSEKNVTRASNDHRGAIAQMNSIYGKYLGFILTEANYTDLAAAAHNKVAAAIEREMLMKQRQAAISEVDSNYAQEISEDYGDLYERLVSFGKLERKEAAKIMSDMQKFMRQNMKYDAATHKVVVDEAITDQLAAKGLDLSQADANEIAALWFDQYLKENYHLSDVKRLHLTGVKINSENEAGWNMTAPSGSNLRADYAKTYIEREAERGAVALVYDVDIDSSKEEENTASTELLKKFEDRANDAKKKILDKSTDDKERNKAYGELANALEGLENRINELDPQKDAETINRLQDMAKSLKDNGIDIKKLKQARDIIHQTLFEQATFDENAFKDLDTTDPWGKSLEASSTDWKNMTAEQLVNRRKQMKDFVNAIQTDTDVKTVLAEDAALKKAIENGMSADMRTVIEWYNTERLKIQDELDARHLTNTGDWKDPKKTRARKKRLQDEMKAYLEELDAYYTERKTKIDEARNDEEISEAEAWNRNIRNEAEWHRRRAELQKMYADKGVEVTKEEQDAILDIIAERTEDDAKYIKATIDKTVKFSKAVRDANEQGAKEYRKFMADLGLGWEKDYNKVEKALHGHLKAIEEIIDKERPFNGIAKNMQDNLGKMGILTADLAEGADSAAEELKRITFLLGEAENAYTITVEKLLDDMRQKGFKEWADVISKDPSMQQGLLAMLRQTFDAVQDAIKKESSIIKKQVEIMMQDITEAAQAEDTRLQILQNSVQRANSLIGAGAASERVADKLAIKQIQMQITLQETRIRMLQKRGADAVALLRQEAELAKQQGDTERAKQKLMDAQNVEKSVGLTLTKEQVELDKQRVALAEKLEETQNRLYTSLKAWGDLLASSVKDLMEASHSGDAEYYNELAKLNLTGKGGPGAGTYIVIDNAGTEDAEAHYEYLSEREALERQHEIERENAQAEAWRKVMDDLNAKMNEQITDWINASLQNQSIDANTNAVLQNTEAIAGLTSSMQGNAAASLGNIATEAALIGTPEGTVVTTNPAEQAITPDQVTEWTDALSTEPWRVWEEAGVNAARNVQQAQKTANQQMQQSTQSTFAKMTVAANLYGAAYQTMSNDNLDASQKWEMFALQAAGQAAISMLTMDLAKGKAENTVRLPGILGKLLGEMPYPAAMATYAAVTAILGGLMGMAVSQVTKSKAQISQVTGASSASAGKLTTGMLQYGEGNVNEFTDPGTLTVGRQYNVDAADGHTYRARYMGKDAKTHLTNGPEFHLVGEKGQEAIIDAHTTRNIRMNDPEIWHSIQTLYNGGSLRHSTRRRGVRAFADGNMEDFEEMSAGGTNGTYGTNGNNEIIAGLQASLDRNSAVLERALEEGFKGIFDVYGKGGLLDSYDTGKKTVMRHGERY